MTADAPDLVTLLYRADWTRLSLAAEVSITIDHDLDEPDSGGPSRSTGDAWEVATDWQGPEVSRSTLLIAPGGRYRHQGTDFSRGRDGDRSWRVDGDHDPVAELGGTRQPALDKLLRPSWLLTGFTLEVGEPVTAGGRDALRVVATPRRGIRGGPAPRPQPAEPRPRVADSFQVIVDAELGILLRCAEIVDGQPLSVTELVSVSLDPADAGDDTRFRPPAGWDGVVDEEAPPVPGAGGVSEKITSLVFSGLGALAKNSKNPMPDSFKRATEEEPEAAMPEQEPLATDGPDAAPVSDEILHLLYASEGRWAPGITATLHEWQDVSARFRGMPDYIRRVSSSGVGVMTKLFETLAQETRDFQLHPVSRLRIGGPDRYQVEHISRDQVTTTTVCDGEQCWTILSDSIMVGPAARVPAGIADLLDASWLLTARLTGGIETTVAGRRGYRLAVVSDDSQRELPPDEVVVDAELGFLLRLISRTGSGSDSRAVAWYELRDVAAYAGAAEDFRPDIPAGKRVITNPQKPADFAGIFAREVANDARSKVEGLLGFLRGGDRD